MARSGPGTWTRPAPADSIARRTRSSPKTAGAPTRVLEANEGAKGETDEANAEIEAVENDADKTGPAAEKGAANEESATEKKGNFAKDGIAEEKEKDVIAEGADAEMGLASEDQDVKKEVECKEQDVAEDDADPNAEEEDAEKSPKAEEGAVAEDHDAEQDGSSEEQDAAEDEDDPDAEEEDDPEDPEADEEEAPASGDSSPGPGRSAQDCDQDSSEIAATRGQTDAGHVFAVAPQTWHSDWGSWQKYFAEYCEKTMQVIPILETMGRAERNRRLKKTKKGQDDSAQIPEGLDPYQRTCICTHGWPKRKPRGTGKRPRQHIRQTDCPFRFVVRWQHHKGKWQLGVKRGTFEHNHHVTTETYATYPCVSGVSDVVVGARVEGMLAVGAKRSKIYDYLLEHDQNVIKADVDNMVHHYAASVATVDDNETTAAEVGVLAAADTSNCTSIAETESGKTGVISLATAFMRLMFSRFGEVLLVDCSHKTNRYNYQLLAFMIMNEFGEDVAVQHSLLEANGDWHMDRAIAHFKRAHPDGLRMLRVIVVDKDMNEVRVLQSHFPEARILICHFHVIKYLKEKRSKPEFGKISADDASQIDAAVHKMVYAASQDEYDSTRTSLRRICSRIGMTEFCDYFTRNWDSCQEMWSMHLRAKLPHFKNHTNNRLKSFFGKLQDDINSNMSMAQCVEALVACDRRTEKEYKYRLSRIGRFVNTNYDEEMANVLRFTAHYVAQQIKPQYAIGLAKASIYTFEPNADDEGEIVVRGRRRLADLENDEEFDEMLGFLIKQWRNVRQKQQVSSMEEHETRPTQADAKRNKTGGGETRPIRAESKCNMTGGGDNDDARGADGRDDESKEPSNNTATSGKVRVRINPKARKVSHPQKKKKSTAANERADRKWYKAADTGRVEAGEYTLGALLESLDRDKPGLEDTQRRLSGVLVKYAHANDKKPVFRKMRNPVLIMDPVFILPPKLLDRCTKLLPIRNTAQNPVEVAADDGAPAAQGGVIEVVRIKDVGSFLRQQIEVFKRVEILKDTVQLGLDAHKWVIEDALPALPAEYHSLAQQVGGQVLAAYPFTQISGLTDMQDYVYSMLYRVIPPTWLTDASTRGLCDRLVADYPSCRVAGIQEVTTKTSRARVDGEEMVTSDLLARIVTQTREAGVETVFLPLNFHNAHWCCIVVKVLAKRIFYYDPLNQKPYMRTAKAVAIFMKHGGLRYYDVVPQNNPIQFDQFRCGVFVCWMFLRQVVPGLTHYMSDNSIVQRRFELFYYILTGRLIAPINSSERPAFIQTQPPAEEETAPAPANPDSDDDEIPPTQAAV